MESTVFNEEINKICHLTDYIKHSSKYCPVQPYIFIKSSNTAQYNHRHSLNHQILPSTLLYFSEHPYNVIFLSNILYDKMKYCYETRRAGPDHHKNSCCCFFLLPPLVFISFLLLSFSFFFNFFLLPFPFLFMWGLELFLISHIALVCTIE